MAPPRSNAELDDVATLLLAIFATLAWLGSAALTDLDESGWWPDLGQFLLVLPGIALIWVTWGLARVRRDHQALLSLSATVALASGWATSVHLAP